MVVQRFLPDDEVVEGVTDRDDLVDGQGVASVDEHALHDLQRRSLALHHAGKRAQRTDERRAEGVGEAEGGFVGPSVPLVGVDPVEQDVPDLTAPIQTVEGLVKNLLGRAVCAPQQATVCHDGEVVVA